MKTDLRRLLARGAEDYISVTAEGSNGAAVVWSLQLPQPHAARHTRGNFVGMFARRREDQAADFAEKRTRFIPRSEKRR